MPGTKKKDAEPSRVKAASGGEVTVAGDRDDHIVVTWVCSGTRTFTRDHAAEVVQRLDGLAKHEGVFLRDVDYYHNAFVATVKGGRLYAGDGLHADLEHVPWSRLKAAVGRFVPKDA